MNGTIHWFHPYLRLLLIEYSAGFVVGSLDAGSCALGDVVSGVCRINTVAELLNLRTGSCLRVVIEAVDISEDAANELLGMMRD